MFVLLRASNAGWVQPRGVAFIRRIPIFCCLHLRRTTQSILQLCNFYVDSSVIISSTSRLSLSRIADDTSVRLAQPLWHLLLPSSAFACKYKISRFLMPFLLFLYRYLTFISFPVSLVLAQHLYHDQIPLQLPNVNDNETSMAHQGHGQECDGFRTVAYFVNWVRGVVSEYCGPHDS